MGFFGGPCLPNLWYYREALTLVSLEHALGQHSMSWTVIALSLHLKGKFIFLTPVVMECSR